MIIHSLLFAAAFAAKAKMLVVLENERQKNEYATVLNQLNEKFETYYKLADDADLHLVKYGKNLYQNAIIMAPSTEEFGGDVKTKTFVDFTQNGGNLMVFASSNIGDAIRELGAEFGIEYDETGTKVMSHQLYDFERDALNHDHSRFQLKASESFLGGSQPIVGPAGYAGLLIDNAVAMKIDKKNTLAFPIVKCNSYCYSWFPNEPITEYPMAVGRDITLVAGIQLRNNARIAFFSSMSMFSNKLIRQKFITYWNNDKNEHAREQNSVNKFSMHVFGWATNNSGTFRIAVFKHNLVDKENQRNDFYYINEEIEVTAIVQEHVEDNWEPASLLFENLWLDFHRLDPFVRMQFENQGGGKFTAKFKVPDTYGVFNFIVWQTKLGHTYLEHKEQITVRPPRHDMYERFIASAYPYYFSSFSMMLGVTLMSFAILYHRDVSPAKKNN
ncbi:unnamed protein product [Oikopleura dioica]|uniref:Dolichyl-diphosphooligosaccharide--protein glycosyltransferase 48 kDa subunit n=1 Tax=Oikopleura dioica TaxID=34765 RepID=E4WQB6_OIKDI|nr:unnamed protein product [Oikopleura dioica]